MRLKTTGSFKKYKFSAYAIFSITLLLMLLPFFTMAQDPTGASTGTIKDLGIDTLAATSDTTLNKMVNAVNTIGNSGGHSKVAINIMWTLIAGFLVMFMQAGFAMVETGFTQIGRAHV